MDLNWDKMFKRYVWHDERTPYLTRVANLSRLQAQYEIFGYSFLMAVLFAALSVVSLSVALPHGNAAVVSIYAFTVCCAAVLLGTTRHPWAAMWCAGAPLAVLAYFGYWGFHPNVEIGDKALLVAGVIAWLLYSRRLVAVARAWQGLAPPD
jgi:hypothetical protein